MTFSSTKRFAEAMRDELKRQSEREGSELWTNPNDGDVLTFFGVDGHIDLNALAEVVIKLALDERFAS